MSVAAAAGDAMGESTTGDNAAGGSPRPLGRRGGRAKTGVSGMIRRTDPERSAGCVDARVCRGDALCVDRPWRHRAWSRPRGGVAYGYSLAPLQGAAEPQRTSLGPLGPGRPSVPSVSSGH